LLTSSSPCRRFLFVALEVFIQETLALPFRRALNQIKPQSVLVDLFEGVCAESQFSCTLQDFFFFCHCHLFCCRLLFCCYWFVFILMAWLYVSACHHKLCLYLLGLKHSFFLLPLPPSLLLIAQQLRGKCSVSEPGSSARLPRHRYPFLGFRMQRGC